MAKFKMSAPAHRVRLNWVLLVTLLTFLLTWYALMWIRLAQDPGGYSSTDYRIFYTPGRLARSGHLSDFYNLELQYQFQQEYFQVTFPPDHLLPFNHPPLLIPIQALLFSENFAASYWRWVIFQSLFLAGSAALAARLLFQQGWDRTAVFGTVVGWLLFYPVFLSLLKGQDTAFLLSGGMLWFYGLQREDDRLAGLGLALMTIRPQIALALAIPFLFKRRRVWWWFCAGGGALAIYSFAMLGSRGVQGFFQVLLVSARGKGYGISPQEMFNFLGVIDRLFPDVDPTAWRLTAWAVYFLAMLFLGLFFRKSKRIGFHQIILLVTVCTFAAPHLHYHDLSLLLLPLLAVMLDSVERGLSASKWAVLFLPAISSLMVLADVTSLRYWGPYLLMLLLVSWPWLSSGALALRRWQLARKGNAS